MATTTKARKKFASPGDIVQAWWMFSLTWKLYWDNAKPEQMPGTGLGMMA